MLTIDLHAGQIQGFFQIPVDHMTATPILADHFMERNFAGDFPEGLVVGEDPELDAKRFRRTASGICLITQPMIDRLAE